MTFAHPTGKVPNSVAIVALGDSKGDLVGLLNQHGQGHGYDEVWAINTAIRWLKADAYFIMDDLETMIRYHADSYADSLKNVDRSVITSVAYPDICPRSVAYPLPDVLGWIADPSSFWFNHSIPYVVAYAAWLGVKWIGLFGCDYVGGIGNTKNAVLERGEPCLAHWIGFVRGRGAKVIVGPSSPLLDTNVPKTPRYPENSWYGYKEPPKINLGPRLS